MPSLPDLPPMVTSSSPWRRQMATDSNLDPSAAGGTAKPICAVSPKVPVWPWPGLWPPRHAARQTRPSMASPSPLQGHKAHLFVSFVRCISETSHWGSTDMVALDNSALFGEGHARFRITLAPLVGAIALVAAMLVLGAIFARGFAENGFRLGSQLAWRYASFVFFAALVAGPLCRLAARLFPRLSPPESLSRKLVWGFCASYGIYLLSVFLPNVIRPSAGAALMVLFGGSVALVMAATATPLKPLGDKAIIPDNIRRVFLAAATIYFWLCYSLMALARIYGPHRPDDFYGLSLCLMVVGLLARYADRWVSHKEAADPAGTVTAH